MGAHDEAPMIQPATRAEWRTWLRRHHAKSSGVWVITYKKSARRDGPKYEDLVREALCFGWIDSRPGTVDAERTRLYLCPRKKGSGWAATNKARIAELIESGQMTPAGQAAIDRAKADGSWEKLDRRESTTVPPALVKALRAYPGSKRNFDAFPPGVRKQLIYWVDDAKRETTRDTRADEVARLAQQNIRANQWVPKDAH